MISVTIHCLAASRWLAGTCSTSWSALISLQLIAQGAASSGLSELIVAVGRSQDPYQLSEKVVPHLETIFKVPVAPDKSKCVTIGRCGFLVRIVWVW